jgi:hypothetical protein
VSYLTNISNRPTSRIQTNFPQAKQVELRIEIIQFRDSKENDFTNVSFDVDFDLFHLKAHQPKQFVSCWHYQN